MRPAQHFGIGIIGLAMLCYAAFLGLAAQNGQLQNAWRQLGVTPLEEMFYDLRPLLNGFACMDKNIDIIRTKPCDPLARTVNYPPVWLKLKNLSANPDWLVPMSSAMVFGFALSVLWLFRRATPQQGILAALCILSPAVMMGVERGNVDLFIFPLVLFGTIWIRAETEWRGIAGTTLLMTAVILKLYPVFAIAALLLLPSPLLRRRLFILLTLSVIYFILEREALALIQTNTPIGTELSYGVMAPWLVHTKTAMALRAHNNTAFWITRAACAALLLTVLFFTRKRTFSHVENTEALALFLAGAGIFCGTFIVTNNWDYRLVFLLLCLPFLFRSRAACAFLIAVLWASAFSMELYYLDELLNLILWIGFGAVLLQFAAQDFLRLRNATRR